MYNQDVTEYSVWDNTQGNSRDELWLFRLFTCDTQEYSTLPMPAQLYSGPAPSRGHHWAPPWGSAAILLPQMILINKFSTQTLSTSGSAQPATAPLLLGRILVFRLESCPKQPAWGTFMASHARQGQQGWLPTVLQSSSLLEDSNSGLWSKSTRHSCAGGFFQETQLTSSDTLEHARTVCGAAAYQTFFFFPANKLLYLHEKRVIQKFFQFENENKTSLSTEKQYCPHNTFNSEDQLLICATTQMLSGKS